MFFILLWCVLVLEIPDLTWFLRILSEYKAKTPKNVSFTIESIVFLSSSGAIQHGARSQKHDVLPASLFDWAFYYDALSSLCVYQWQGGMGLRHRKLRSACEILCRFFANRGFSTVWGLFSPFFWGNNISNCSIKHVITVRWYLISFNALNDSEMSTRGAHSKKIWGGVLCSGTDFCSICVW
jgi:hypothetical protein